MGESITRKIIRSHFVSGSMKAGEDVFLKVDHTLTHDINAVMTYLAFEAIGMDRIGVERSVSSMRSNIPLMSKYCYHRYDPEFAARAKAMGKSIIIGGENYGQGSSREHADYLVIENFPEQIADGRVKVTDENNGYSFDCKLDLSDAEKAVILDGGQLRHLREVLRNTRPNTLTHDLKGGLTPPVDIRP